jgi:sterol desaturase/sphingolipid hydroxylase (fatty acid hydroxylase superfamily)
MNLTEAWYSLVEVYPPGSIEVVLSIVSQVTILVVYGSLHYIAKPADRAAMRKCVPLVALNVVLDAAGHVAALKALSSYRHIGSVWEISLTSVRGPLPTRKQLVLGFIKGTLLFDLLFYHVHRLLHTRPFRKIHSIHHRFPHEVPLAAYYVHPAEFVLVNFSVPVAISVWMQSHVLSMVGMGAFSVFAAMWIHSGHDMFFMMNHEGHHIDMKKNIGAVGMMDMIYGTLYRRQQIEQDQRIMKQVLLSELD